LHISQPVKPTPRGRIYLSQEPWSIGALCATNWFISLVAVPSWQSTIGLEKSLETYKTCLYLATEILFNDMLNCSWATWVNVFYTRNPHLLRDALLHVQENFTANLLEVHRKSPMKEEHSSLFSHLESINKKDEELS